MSDGPRSCPICAAVGSETLYDLPAGALARCAICGIVWRQNLVTEDRAFELYEDDSYLDAPYFEALKVGAPRDVEPYLVYGRVLDRLAQLGPMGDLLDMGCSYGAFMELAAEAGWRAIGLELSRKASDYANRERQVEVFTGTLEQARYADDRFAAITLWDVIEHLDRPLETARELRRILAPGGTLMLFTINQKSLMNRVGHALNRASFGVVRKPLDLLYDIHHNFFFDRDTLAAALRRAGFAERIEVDWMDANIDRWQNVPIPPLLALGSKGLDLVSRMFGGRYRMIVYATKEAADPPTPTQGHG